MRTLKTGITMLEILVVVAVVGILAAIAVPNLAQIIPYAELRNEARYLASAMREARLMAANTHKPTRVVVDCANSPCVLRSYVALFEDDPANPGELGRFSRWAGTPSDGAERRLAASVNVGSTSGLNPGLGTTENAGDNIFWAVFLPEGRMIGSHVPFRLTLVSAKNSRRRVLEVNGATGRAAALEAD